MGDNVACLQRGSIGRRAIDRRDDLQPFIVLFDSNSEAAELAADAIPHGFEIRRIEIGAVPVEGTEHAVDRRHDQFAVIDALGIRIGFSQPGTGRRQQRLIGHGAHVVLAHPFEDAGKGGQRRTRQLGPEVGSGTVGGDIGGDLARRRYGIGPRPSVVEPAGRNRKECGHEKQRPHENASPR